MLSTFFIARPSGALLCLWTDAPEQTRQRLLTLAHAPACGVLRKPVGEHLVLAWADTEIEQARIRATLHGLGAVIDWPGRLVVGLWDPWYGEAYTVQRDDCAQEDIPAWLARIQEAAP